MAAFGRLLRARNKVSNRADERQEEYCQKPRHLLRTREVGAHEEVEHRKKPGQQQRRPDEQQKHHLPERVPVSFEHSRLLSRQGGLVSPRVWRSRKRRPLGAAAAW